MSYRNLLKVNSRKAGILDNLLANSKLISLFLDAVAGFPIENMNFFGGYGKWQDGLSIKVMDIGKANR